MIPINGFHVEPTNICTLKCSGCARTRFIDQWPQHWKNHNLDIDDFLNFLDIDITDLKITFCGNYGDPIYHPRFIEMVSRIKNRGAHVSIITNGSYKTRDWWNDLCRVLTKTDSIQFSIDGVPENFTNYRINADWKSIRQGIEICVSNKINTIWKFIPFKFNQQDIESARIISKELGMSEFLLDPSDRYDNKTEHLIPVDELVGSRKFARENSVKEIDPKCYRGKEHFITATGHYSPCCFVADHRFYYKTVFGKTKSFFDIRKVTFSQLMFKDPINEFFDDLSKSPPAVCQFNCPKI